jgi:hypothetical protein
MMHSPRASNRRYLPTSPFKPPPEEPPAEQYELDDLVTPARHSRLGRQAHAAVPRVPGGNGLEEDHGRLLRD